MIAKNRNNSILTTVEVHRPPLTLLLLVWELDKDTKLIRLQSGLEDIKMRKVNTVLSNMCISSHIALRLPFSTPKQ